MTNYRIKKLFWSKITPVGKLHQSLLSFITNSLIIKEIVKNLVDIRETISTTKDQPVTLAIEISLTIREKGLFKVIKNSPIKEITIPNSISILHNILGIPTMVPINDELFVNYVTKLATVPRYVVPDHHHASHLKPTTRPGIKPATVTLG